LSTSGSGDFALVVFGTGADPVDEGLVGGAVFFEELAAGVGNGSDGLGEEQRLLGQGEIDPAAGVFAGQAEVVALGIEAEQREVEAVLAAGGAVAGAGVAAG
jgi:hypothetical protein